MPDLRNSSFPRRVERSMQGADHRANRLGCIFEFGAEAICSLFDQLCGPLEHRWYDQHDSDNP